MPFSKTRGGAVSTFFPDLIVPQDNPFLCKTGKNEDEISGEIKEPGRTRNHARCALIIYGLPKHFKHDVLPLLRQHIVSRLACQCDFFIHSYDVKVITSASTRIAQMEVGHEIRVDDLLYVKPVALELQNQEEVDAEYEQVYTEMQQHGDAWNDNFVALRNVIRRDNSLARGFKLMEVHEAEFNFRYSLVCCSRSDTLFLDDLPDACVDSFCALSYDMQSELHKQNNDLIWLPSFAEWYLATASRCSENAKAEKTGGLNDRFAIGGREAMFVYANRLAAVDEYFAELQRPLHTETFIKWHLERAGIRLQKMPFLFLRIRADRSISFEDAMLLTEEERQLILPSAQERRGTTITFQNEAMRAEFFKTQKAFAMAARGITESGQPSHTVN